jgi:glycosyltransferase involved in cell wall biosynthesis
LRKGIDILVNAYLSEFKADEPVCLVIKDSRMYTKGLAVRIRELSSRNDIASICYTEENIDHSRLPGLYTACDCYVHPYRAEGYGLPIAEAMACGKPVIVTGAGACLDFVEPDDAFFIKSVLEKMREKNVSGMATVDFPYWVVPDMKHLQELMRYVFCHQQLAKELGIRAGNRIRSDHTWKHAARRAAERIIAVASGTSSRSGS